MQVTKEQVDEFLERWERGEFKFQRLGQAFCNTFLDGSEPFPELFYEKNNGAAMRRIIHIQQAGGINDGASKN